MIPTKGAGNNLHLVRHEAAAGVVSDRDAGHRLGAGLQVAPGGVVPAELPRLVDGRDICRGGHGPREVVPCR